MAQRLQLLQTANRVLEVKLVLLVPKVKLVLRAKQEQLDLKEQQVLKASKVNKV